MLCVLVFPLLGILLAWPTVHRLLKPPSISILGGRARASAVLGFATLPLVVGVLGWPFEANSRIAFKKALVAAGHGTDRSVSPASAVELHDFVARNVGWEAVSYDAAIWIESAFLWLVFLPANAALVLAILTQRRAWGLATQVLAALPWLCLLAVFVVPSGS